MSMSYGDFPKWTNKGSKVVDGDDNTWVVVDRYITGSYNHDWGVLHLEHESIPGLEVDVDVSEVRPSERQLCKTCGLPEFFMARSGEPSCGCP